MEPSPTTLPPGVAALAKSLGLGQLADQAEAVLSANPQGPPPTAQPALTHSDPQLVAAIAHLRTELAELRADLQPLMGLAAQLAPLLALPKVQRALTKQQA